MEQIWGADRRRVRLVDERPGHRLSPQYGIPDEWGTAVNVMAMVFGNLGDDCATGVALTRDGPPASRASTATT